MTALANAARPAPRRPNALLGMLVFVTAECMFFVGLGFAALQLRRTVPAWPPEGAPGLDVPVILASTAILLASSVTARRAVEHARRDERAAAGRGMLVTVALGGAFLAAQARQFVLLGGWRPAEGLYGTLFELLAGFHGLHVLVGLLAWAPALAAARWKHPARTVHARALVGELYWHFVTLVWLALLALWFMP